MKKINIIRLNPIYNLGFIQTTIFLLNKHLARNNPKFFNINLQKYILLPKTQIMINCWRLYFKELYPILRTKYSPLETRRLINLIFGNEIKQYRKLDHTTALSYNVNIALIAQNLQLYKKKNNVYKEHKQQKEIV